ncbi:MAG: SDR family oxidoreductase, partial [Bacteroidetes bacterium]|nr:SDR family oxidoreductase [Bacteroidota bacterium]
ISAKAGLIGLTKALAVELAEHGITANCVAPGTIDTARGASAGRRPGFAGGALIDRLGRPEEIAALVQYLCSPAARYTARPPCCFGWSTGSPGGLARSSKRALHPPASCLPRMRSR